MRITCALAAMAAVVCLVAAGCDPGHGDILGTVYDERGAPAAEVPVRAQQPGQHGVLLRTDANGRYQLLSLATGEWTIEVFDSAGWLVGVESTRVRRDQTVSLDFNFVEALPEGVVPYRVAGVP